MVSLVSNNLPNNVQSWVLAVRPHTLWAAIVPVALAISLAFKQGYINNIIATITLITAILIQILTNLVNDYVDGIKGTDQERIGPTRVTAAGLISPSQLLKAIYIIGILSLCLGSFLVWRGGWPILLIGCLALICAVWYSYGPLALSYSGLADVFVLIFFGPIATFGTYYLLALEWSSQAFILGLAPGFISIAILTVNNARDYKSDLAANKKTLAVRFGLSFAKFQYFICLFSALLLPVLIMPDFAMFVAGLLTALFAIKPAGNFLKAQTAEDFLPLLPKTARLLIIYLLAFLIVTFTNYLHVLYP